MVMVARDREDPGAELSASEPQAATTPMNKAMTAVKQADHRRWGQWLSSIG